MSQKLVGTEPVQYRIKGANKVTGADVELILWASSPKAATAQANAMGVLVETAEIVAPKSKPIKQGKLVQILSVGGILVAIVLVSSAIVFVKMRVDRLNADQSEDVATAEANVSPTKAALSSQTDQNRNAEKSTNDLAGIPSLQSTSAPITPRKQAAPQHDESQHKSDAPTTQNDAHREYLPVGGVLALLKANGIKITQIENEAALDKKDIQREAQTAINDGLNADVAIKLSTNALQAAKQSSGFETRWRIHIANSAGDTGYINTYKYSSKAVATKYASTVAAGAVEFQVRNFRFGYSESTAVAFGLRDVFSDEVIGGLRAVAAPAGDPDGLPTLNAPSTPLNPLDKSHH